MNTYIHSYHVSHVSLVPKEVGTIYRYTRNSAHAAAFTQKSEVKNEPVSSNVDLQNNMGGKKNLLFAISYLLEMHT